MRSRYSSVYAEFDRDQRTQVSPLPGVLDSQSYLRDIANGDCGNVKVSCWPSPEGVEVGRKWGKWRTTDIVIMPFRLRAGLLSPSIRLDHFETEVFVCEPDRQGHGPLSFPPTCRDQQGCSHSGIWLVQIPAPAYLSSHGNASPSALWTFKSEGISDCDGWSRAARWSFCPNGHEPRVLYGSLALKHLNKPFIMACKVRGAASIEIPASKLRLRFKFGNETE